MTTRRLTLGGGTGLVLAGLVTLTLSRVVDSGFVHGMFLGMTVALMLLGAYALGRGMRSRGRDDAGLWRPSEDRRG
ncbi:hypothetical protein G7075_05185 [Phycicoccus sp. HDW14]|uniref:hypothetical protein n=1 Tax=Phycicoccus sp. HDW14 TaxID=2714941 RepID=UPI00140C8E69|nr:hypothetical protein [Phycicoccus sp. HDW14]QIM20684.1 hypothetical protein G7075_05185 [Phycicoccus sp. HDW14]